MAVDFKTFNSCAPYILNVRKPIMIRGRHGVGKSEVVYQIADKMCLPIIERRASQMTEGDLLGMPGPEGVEVNGELASKFRPFAWFIQACTEPVVLFLDEVDRAAQEVRQGLFELTDSRKLAGWTLHEDTVIIAAINGGDHGDQYQVNEMDPAELDRWTVFDIEPTVEDWLDWGADGNIESVIWDFVNHNRNHLEHKTDFEPNKVYPSRRSWKRLNDCLKKGDLFTEPTPTLYTLACAFVGFEAAVAFKTFFETYERQVTVEDVLDNGQINKTSAFDLNEHCALIEKFDAAGVFGEEMNETRVQNLANYAVTLPSEAFMKLWSTVGAADVQKNVTGLHSTVSDTGIKVSSYIVEILTGKNNSQE